MNNSIRELNLNEINEVNAGVLPLAAFGAAFAKGSAVGGVGVSIVYLADKYLFS